MKAFIDTETNELIIRLPLLEPSPSKSGKTLIVATTSGIKSTSAIVQGKPVQIGVNAFIPKD